MAIRVAGFWGLAAAQVFAQSPPTCRLEGTVVDPMQRPVAGAEVRAEVSGELVSRTFTDAEGAFVLAQLPWAVVTLRATAAAPEIGAEWVDLLGLERHHVSIVTAPARRVTGVVRDDAGTAMPLAWVVAAPFDCDRLALASTMVQCDTSGNFVLPHVAFGKNLLRAWAPDHDAFEGEVDGNRDAFVECRVERDASQERFFVLTGDTSRAPTAALDLTVLHGGFPLPLPAALRRIPLIDGRWTVRGWSFADAMVVRATIGGAPAVPVRYDFPEGSGRRERAFADRGEAGRLTGRIVGARGPHSAWIVIERVDNDARVPLRTFTRSGDDGTFVAAVPVEPDDGFRLRVLDPTLAVDRTGPQRSPWFCARHDGTTKHTIGVHPAHSIRVRIERPDRTPVPGAMVRIVEQSSSKWVGGWQAEVASGTTARDGSLTMVGLDLDADVSLTCLVDSPAGWCDEAFVTTGATLTDLGTLVVDPGAAVVVTSVDTKNEAIGGSRLWLGAGRSPAISWSDRDGRLRLSGLRAQSLVVRSQTRPEDEVVLAIPAHGVLTANIKTAP
ncbi:MAG: carboxypeptidase regulatory-like domain-containing protein [Planctomycetes bacterium]|nr:carboxypeptidase regulatory-like domain-containing protein [Planctomycetota bacterium]